MQTQGDRGLGWLLWPAVIEGVCAAIIASFVFIALGYLHPAFALPPVGLGILAALARPARVDAPSGVPPSDTTDPRS